MDKNWAEWKEILRNRKIEKVKRDRIKDFLNVDKALCHFIGVKSAIWMAYMIKLSKKNGCGWFNISMPKIQAEINLTKREQMHIRKNLIEMKLIFKRIRGGNRRSADYFINYRLLDELNLHMDKIPLSEIKTDGGILDSQTVQRINGIREKMKSDDWDK